MIHGRFLPGASVLLVISLIGIGWTQVVGQGITPGGTQQPFPPAAVPAGSSFDQPIAWLHEARRNFTAVQDYTCTLTKREKVNGVLSDEHFIEAKFRTQPFSVYMRWLAPAKYYGQEVAFILGRNNNKMRVHSKGLLKGAVGFVTIDINDRRVFEHSRHTINEAGIGTMIEQVLKSMETERQLGAGQVRASELLYDNRRCLRVEIIRNNPRQSELYRTVLVLDKEAKFPIRAENYEWPRQGGPSGGDLAEQVNFTGIRWNLGLTDKEFNK
jgi:hypothetical protein